MPLGHIPVGVKNLRFLRGNTRDTLFLKVDRSANTLRMARPLVSMAKSFHHKHAGRTWQDLGSMCEKVVVPRALLLCGPVCHGCQDSEADQAGGRQDSCDNSNRREPKVKKQLFLFNNQNWTTIDNPFELSVGRCWVLKVAELDALLRLPRLPGCWKDYYAELHSPGWPLMARYACASAKTFSKFFSSGAEGEENRHHWEWVWRGKQRNFSNRFGLCDVWHFLMWIDGRSHRFPSTMRCWSKRS